MNKICLVSFVLLLALVIAAGCNSQAKPPDPAAEAPPPALVEHAREDDVFAVEKPSLFPLATASAIQIATSVNATGSVLPDVSRQIPVISLASGRVIEIHARLGDTVRQGQLLMRIQSADISSAFADYEKAVADEKLARTQMERSRDLKERGAIAQKDLEVAENNEEDAQVTVRTTREHLRVFGADLNRPSSLVDIRAPVSGVITEQNVTAAAGVKTLDNSPSLFTISDLSELWVVCDVYENDLPQVRMGEYADVRFNAYPNLALRGRISDIGRVLDPTIRTAKVRLQMRNPGVLRVGMFATATFHGSQSMRHATVPASAVLHLHDRDWVYSPAGDGKFRRLAVVGGKMLPNNLQEIVSGLDAGQQVVANALALQDTIEQ